MMLLQETALKIGSLPETPSTANASHYLQIFYDVGHSTRPSKSLHVCSFEDACIQAFPTSQPRLAASYSEKSSPVHIYSILGCNEAWTQRAVFWAQGRMADLLDHGMSDRHILLPS